MAYVRTTLNLSEDVHAALVRIAEQEERSISQVASRLLRQHLQKCMGFGQQKDVEETAQEIIEDQVDARIAREIGPNY